MRTFTYIYHTLYGKPCFGGGACKGSCIFSLLHVGVGWCGARTSLHLHTHLLLRHIFFILLRHMNFSSTSTSSSHYVIHFSCCYVLRSSLALPYLLLVTVRYIMFLRLRHKNLFCKSTTTSRYVTWITWCFVTRTSLESMIRHHNYLVLLIQVQAILQYLCLNMYM